MEKRAYGSPYDCSCSGMLQCLPFESMQVTSDKVASHARLNTDRGESNHEVPYKFSIPTEARLLEKNC
jgi:hypothetical protein